jgi:hypothetical protein
VICDEMVDARALIAEPLGARLETRASLAPRSGSSVAPREAEPDSIASIVVACASIVVACASIVVACASIVVHCASIVVHCASIVVHCASIVDRRARVSASCASGRED